MKRLMGCFSAGLLFTFTGIFSLPADDKCDEAFIKEISEFSMPDMTSIADYYERASRKIVYVTRALVSYEISKSYYHGGAHANYEAKRGSIFRKTGKKLTIKDIAPQPAQQRMLLALIKRGVMKSRNVKTLKELQERNITPFLTEKFYYTKKGLHFYYDPYEIACFADGAFDICVPWAVPDFVLQYEKELQKKGDHPLI